MADRFPAVGMKSVNLLKRVVLSVALISVTVLFGCESVPMPDMSKFDFNLMKEKPVVSIKQSYSKVNIRPTPSTDMAPVASLKGGDKVKLYEEKGNWLKVTFYDTTGKEQEGWIYKYLVEGYEKPEAQGGTASGSSDNGEQNERAAEPEPLEVEKTADPQDLPKSESVSPL